MGDTPATPSAAVAKQLYLIDLANAQDVSDVPGPNANLSAYPVPKTPTPFLDLVSKLTGAPLYMDARLIPSKIEGVAFGQDVRIGDVIKHTLYLTNDNDFLGTIPDPLAPTTHSVANPNQFYVFAFDDADLPGFAPQQIHFRTLLECGITP